jgi:hypothetical protein
MNYKKYIRSIQIIKFFPVYFIIFLSISTHQSLETNVVSAQTHATINSINALIEKAQAQINISTILKDDKCARSYFDRLGNKPSKIELHQLFQFVSALKEFKRCNPLKKIKSEIKLLKKDLQNRLKEKSPCGLSTAQLKSHCPRMIRDFHQVIDDLGNAIKEQYQSSKSCSKTIKSTQDLKCLFIKSYRSKKRFIELISKRIEQEKREIQVDLEKAIKRKIDIIFNEKLGDLTEELPSRELKSLAYLEGVVKLMKDLRPLRDFLEKNGLEKILKKKNQLTLIEAQDVLQEEALRLISKFEIDSIDCNLETQFDTLLRDKGIRQIERLLEKTNYAKYKDFQLSILSALSDQKQSCFQNLIDLTLHDFKSSYSSSCLNTKDLEEKLKQHVPSGSNKPLRHLLKKYKTLKPKKTTFMSQYKTKRKDLFLHNSSNCKVACQKQIDKKLSSSERRLSLRKPGQSFVSLFEKTLYEIKKSTACIDQDIQNYQDSVNKALRSWLKTYLKSEIKGPREAAIELVELDKLISSTINNTNRNTYLSIMQEFKEFIYRDKNLKKHFSFIRLNKKNNRPQRFYPLIYIGQSKIRYAIDAQWLDHFISHLNWIRYYKGFKDCTINQVNGDCPSSNQRKRKVLGFFMGLTEVKYDHLISLCEGYPSLKVCQDKKQLKLMKNNREQSIHSVSLKQVVEMMQIFGKITETKSKVYLPTYDQYVAASKGRDSISGPLPLARTFKELSKTTATNCKSLLPSAEGYLEGQAYQDPYSFISELYSGRKELTRTALKNNMDGEYLDLNLNAFARETNLIVAGGQSIHDFTTPLECLAKWYDLMNMEFGDSEVSMRLVWEN